MAREVEGIIEVSAAYHYQTRPPRRVNVRDLIPDLIPSYGPFLYTFPSRSISSLQSQFLYMTSPLVTWPLPLPPHLAGTSIASFSTQPHPVSFCPTLPQPQPGTWPR
ncbi:hypothetical protein Pmani_012740 [Petrolisthes manimaculis]|uniref:Uncharacterized protein n=1 Tax=Petrolisthes manimaculis TaxID=1843537 RepID=A0AAE1PWQ3_9EUCA|nr:hypothetical protein Pmani_012740 [Petrolisthes manimaculis]